MRALTNALLQDCGYEVTRFVSLETSIARSADAYHASLLASTHGWHEGQHDPWPWLRYFVGVVSGTYQDFAGLTSAARSGGSKQDRVSSTFGTTQPRTSRSLVSGQLCLGCPTDDQASPESAEAER